MDKSEGSIYSSPAFSEIQSPQSPLATKLGVRFINTGVLHSDAWEGSCRVGKLEHLTYESEKAHLHMQLDNLKKELQSKVLPPEARLIEPVSVYSWAEKGNPDITLPKEQLDALEKHSNETDVYIVTHAYEGVKIAERYKKPVIIMNKAGWAVDMPGALRSMGIDSFHAEDLDAVFGFLHVFAARKAFGRTRLLNVTNFPRRHPWGVVSARIDLDFVKQQYAMDYAYLDYETFFKIMDKVTADHGAQRRAEDIAALLMSRAAGNNMTKEDIAKSVLFYLAVIEAMLEHDCNAFTIECFELCSFLEPWNRRFTPCLAHALLKDTGYPSACEGDVNALLAMMVEMYLSRKAPYMGNPTVNKETDVLNIHHSVASLKMKGVDGTESPFSIYSFTDSGFGATLRHDFAQNKGETATVGRFDPSGTKILATKGQVIGGRVEGLNCSQCVDIKIPNGYEFWRESQNFGHHLSFVYGDYINNIRDLGDIMGFETVAIT
jgi:hypothetical protein